MDDYSELVLVEIEDKRIESINQEEILSTRNRSKIKLDGYKSVPGIILKFKHFTRSAGTCKADLASKDQDMSYGVDMKRIKHVAPVRAFPSDSLQIEHFKSNSGNDRINAKKAVSKLSELSEKVTNCYDFLQSKVLRESSQSKQNLFLTNKIKKKWYELFHSEIQDNQLSQAFSEIKQKISYLETGDIIESNLAQFTERLLTFFIQTISEIDDFIIVMKQKHKKLLSKVVDASVDLNNSVKNTSAHNFNMPTVHVHESSSRQSRNSKHHIPELTLNIDIPKKSISQLASPKPYQSQQSRAPLSYSDLEFRKKLIVLDEFQAENPKNPYIKANPESESIKVDPNRQKHSSSFMANPKCKLNDAFTNRKQSSPVGPSSKDTPHWHNPFISSNRLDMQKIPETSHTGFSELVQHKSLSNLESKRCHSSNPLNSDGISINRNSQRDLNQQLREFLQEFKANTSQILSQKDHPSPAHPKIIASLCESIKYTKLNTE